MNPMCKRVSSGVQIVVCFRMHTHTCGSVRLFAETEHAMNPCKVMKERLQPWLACPLGNIQWQRQKSERWSSGNIQWQGQKSERWSSTCMGVSWRWRRSRLHLRMLHMEALRQGAPGQLWLRNTIVFWKRLLAQGSLRFNSVLLCAEHDFYFPICLECHHPNW